MKKSILFITLILFGFLAKSQIANPTGFYVNALEGITLKGDTITYFYTIEPNDTIVSKSYVDSLSTSGLDSITYSGDGYLRIWFDGETLDSVYLATEGFIVKHDTTLIGAGVLEDPLKVDTAIIATKFYVDSQFDSLLNIVYTDSTLIGDGTENNPLGVNLSTLENTANSVFTITLPQYTTVSERCTNAIAGVDYPLGWTLTEDISDFDLSITHNLGRRIADVNVFMVYDNEERLLRGNLGYSGYIAKSNNRLVIESLSTVGYPIVIHLIFAP